MKPASPTKVLYLDILSGISGDMFLGALIDLGVDPALLQQQLNLLDVHGYHLHVHRDQRSSIAGVKFDVHLDHSHTHQHSHADDPSPSQEHSHPHGDSHDHSHDHPHDHAAHPNDPSQPPHSHHHHPHSHEHTHDHQRTFSEIRSLIQASALGDWVKSKSIAVFHRVAVAEGKIHGHPPDDVHFHEVGAVDSIVDIVGACIALELLGRPRVESAPVVDGSGWVTCAHGRFPVPTTATLEILAARGIAISQCPEPHELVTPTGAALLAEFAQRFGPMTGLRPNLIGYGLGSRTLESRPNVLRAVLGETGVLDQPHDWETDQVVLLETNIDDTSAEILGHALQSLLHDGALDVFYSPILMKKNRPGTLVSVLALPGEADRLTALLMAETSAFGVRRSTWERRKLRRESRPVTTPWGPVHVKLGSLDGRIVQRAPEFEDCRRIAEAHAIPIKTVYESALRAFEASASSL